MSDAIIQHLDPREVLFEYDGPRLFTVENARGDLLLAYWMGEVGDGVSRFLVVPASDLLVTEMINGRITIRAALEQQSWAWVVEREDATDALGKIERVDVTALDERLLPRPGALLVASLDGGLLALASDEA